MDEENVNHDETPEEPLDETFDQEPQPLCPNCLNPCNPLDYYCPHCGSNETLNPLASYMPFVNLRFQIGMWGKLWTRCLSRQTNWIMRCLYLALFLLFYPFFLLIALPLAIFERLNKKEGTVQEDSK